VDFLSGLDRNYMTAKDVIKLFIWHHINTVEVALMSGHPDI